MSTRRELWVETEGCGRCRLDGNPHTFHGRIGAWSETLGTGVTISRSDVRQASPEAWAWIEGFLAGNEPELHEFLGIEALNAEMLPEDDPAHGRYAGALAAFHATGSWPFEIAQRPTLPPPPGLSRLPWTAAGGEVLGWDGGAWVPLDPQPELHFVLLAGTVCDERGHHERDEAGDHHVFCPDCGELSEVASVG
jgi:hypothetical protein